MPEEKPNTERGVYPRNARAFAIHILLDSGWKTRDVAHAMGYSMNRVYQLNNLAKRLINVRIAQRISDRYVPDTQHARDMKDAWESERKRQ